jgi:hypothetical protein
MISFKLWLESHPDGIWTLYPYPGRVNIYFEPEGPQIKDGGEYWQKIRTYQVDLNKNTVQVISAEMVPVEDIEGTQPIQLKNPIWMSAR